MKYPHEPRSGPFTPEAPGSAQVGLPQEVLVTDARAGLTPSDMVQRKFLALLQGALMAGSHVRIGGPRARGSHECLSPAPRDPDRGRAPSGSSPP